MNRFPALFLAFLTSIASSGTCHEPQIVQTITDIEVQIQVSDPPNLIVTAIGIVPTYGYTNMQLLPAVYVQPPTDGVQDYFLIATPPCDPAATVQTEVSGTHVFHAFTVDAPWLTGIRVHGIEDGIATGPVGDGLRVRRNIMDLSASEIATLEQGVQVMKSRPVSDRTSWSFQANIHGENTPASNPMWNQCQHGTRHFFDWHRVYLLEFENILRDASGDASFTLPYWDWSTAPSLPSAFRNSSSPLFESTRSINGGELLPPEVVIDDFFNSLNQTSFNSFSNQFEGSPHGTVHVLIGGKMGSVPTAANDPIFWLHHCNIDRVWDSWIALGGPRQNPTDAGFLNREYTLVGATGDAVTHRVADLLESSALGYRYADVGGGSPSPTPSIAPPTMLTVAMAAPPQHPSAASSARAGDDAEDSSPTSLGLESKRIELTLRDEAKPQLMRASADASSQSKERIIVEVIGLKAEKAPRFSYSIYLNLPEEDISAEIKRLYRVGTLNLFGIADHAHDGDEANHHHSDENDPEENPQSVQRYDATQTVAKLREAGLWDEAKISVTLEPVTPIATTAEDRQPLRAMLEKSSEESEITFDRIDVRVVQE